MAKDNLVVTVCAKDGGAESKYIFNDSKSVRHFVEKVDAVREIGGLGARFCGFRFGTVGNETEVSIILRVPDLDDEKTAKLLDSLRTLERTDDERED